MHAYYEKLLNLNYEKKKLLLFEIKLNKNV